MALASPIFEQRQWMKTGKRREVGAMKEINLKIIAQDIYLNEVVDT